MRHRMISLAAAAALSAGVVAVPAATASAAREAVTATCSPSQLAVGDLETVFFTGVAAPGLIVYDNGGFVGTVNADEYGHAAIRYPVATSGAHDVEASTFGRQFRAVASCGYTAT